MIPVITFCFFCSRTKSYFIISIWREDNPYGLFFLLMAVVNAAAVEATALVEDLLLLWLLVLPLNEATLFPLASW